MLWLFDQARIGTAVSSPRTEVVNGTRICRVRAPRHLGRANQAMRSIRALESPLF